MIVLHPEIKQKGSNCRYFCMYEGTKCSVHCWFCLILVYNCEMFFVCLSFLSRRQFLPMCLVYDFSLNDLLAPSKSH